MYNRLKTILQGHPAQVGTKETVISDRNIIFWSDLDPFAGSFGCVIWYFNRSLKICVVFNKKIR
jgi:hypothetical protein